MFLSIDSFSEILGISLIKDHKLLFKETLNKTKPFSELIIERIDSIFNFLGIEKKLLVGVVINKGPGAFTSLRVGITVGKTLSYGLKIPLYAYTSLDVMAYRYRFFKGEIICGINAGKGEVYFRKYKAENFHLETISEIKLVKKGELLNEGDENTLFVVKNIDIHNKNTIQIVDDLSVDGCFYALKNNLKENPMKLEPLYIRGL